MKPELIRRVVAEFVGTMFLLMVVVGSGIMGDRLSGGNVAVALLANSVATGAGLVALILALGPLSGAHLNPLVTLAEFALRRFTALETAGYVAAQVAGAACGVLLTHVMFSLPVVTMYAHPRHGTGQWVAEFIATFGLFMVIFGCARHRPDAVAFAVGAYITAAYWFTASTSFANPAVTLARALTGTFTGIRLSDVPGFLGAQVLGAIAATALFQWLWRPAQKI